MLRGNAVRGGILCALLSAATMSCGERNATEPDLPSRIVAIPASDVFTGSPQLESRELLIDGRPTDIEWNIAGDPVVVLLHGSEAGGDYFASVRALWSYNPFGGDSVALYLLVQWPDRNPNVLEEPLITSIDWTNDDNQSLIDCQTSDPLHVEGNWRRGATLHEDQVEVEIFSDTNGSAPADLWRWGSGTTDPVTPVAATEFTTADPVETQGSTLHPTGGWAEDFFNPGAGYVRDAGNVTYAPNHLPGSNVPLFIANKGTRDTRLNRGKPVPIIIWRYVMKPLEPCDSLNPIRVDDAAARQKTWNPGDYVPSYISGMPSGSQADVVARGGWEAGKWALEMRRLLDARDPDVGSTRGAIHPDDVPLRSGRTYGFRIRIYNASKTQSSVSGILPLYLKPRS